MTPGDQRQWVHHAATRATKLLSIGFMLFGFFSVANAEDGAASSMQSSSTVSPETARILRADLPSYVEFRSQLACTTKKFVELYGKEKVTETVAKAAAEFCVPDPYKPDMTDVEDFIPSTREERLVSLAQSTVFRFSLCSRMISERWDNQTCAAFFTKQNQQKK